MTITANVVGVLPKAYQALGATHLRVGAGGFDTPLAALAAMCTWREAVAPALGLPG